MGKKTLFRGKAAERRGLDVAETDSLLGALAGDLPAALPVRCFIT